MHRKLTHTFAPYLIAVSLAGCGLDVQTTPVTVAEKTAYFHCSGWVGSTQLWLSADRFSSRPDSLRDYLFNAYRPDVLVRADGDTLVVYDNHSLVAPPQPSFTLFVRTVQVPAPELQRLMDMAHSEGLTLIRC